eukprot:165333-Pelagomonas_calceolata.AAC.1
MEEDKVKGGVCQESGQLVQCLLRPREGLEACLPVCLPACPGLLKLSWSWQGCKSGSSPQRRAGHAAKKWWIYIAAKLIQPLKCKQAATCKHSPLPHSKNNISVDVLCYLSAIEQLDI